VRDEIVTRVWYAARRQGLTIPGAAAPTKEHGPALLARLRRVFPQFGFREPTELANATVRQYARGERIVREGEPLPGLHLILAGMAELSVGGADGKAGEVAVLSPGEYIGEKAFLGGRTSEVNVTALEDLEVVVLDDHDLHRLLDRDPRLARELGAVMEDRRRAAHAVRRLSLKLG
jgi:CRP-like cAMP-binding protein